MPSIRNHFDTLEDPRRNHWNIDHKLGDVLFIALCAVLGGAEGWKDIETFGKAKKAWFDQKLSLTEGIPSDDTFRRVISRIDPKSFGACFRGWVRASVDTLSEEEHGEEEHGEEEHGEEKHGGEKHGEEEHGEEKHGEEKHGEELIAIDGKTLRGSYEDGDPKAAVHMVSAWASANEMVLAQRKTDDKSNEITAIPELLAPELLALLELNGCLVTIDAMGCQKEIARQIWEAEADYVLALKGNQGHLHREVREYFEEAKKRGFPKAGFPKAMPTSCCEESAVGHNRKEVRRCVVSTDVEWLGSYGEWAGLKSIALVEYCRDVYASDDPRAETKQRFYISSMACEAEELLEATRRHWEIENKVHWVLDVSFAEDDSRIRRRDGAENFSRLRRMALNLLRSDDTANRKSIKGRRKQAGWDQQYLERLVNL